MITKTKTKSKAKPKTKPKPGINYAESVAEVIATMKASTPDHVLAAVDLFMKAKRPEQMELLALQMQHVVHGITVLTALANHIHGITCPHTVDGTMEDIAKALGIETESDGRVTHEAPKGKQ